MKLNKLELARQDAEDAVRLDPKTIQPFNTLTQVLIDLEDYEEADGTCESGNNNLEMCFSFCTHAFYASLYVQQKPLNGITLGQRQTDSNNQLMSVKVH